MMKRTDQEQDRVASFSRLRSGQNCKPSEQKAMSGRLSSTGAASTPRLQYSNTPSLRLTEVEDEDENEAPIHFCGLSLELSARAVMDSETVLPKAVKTAGILMPRSDLGLASDALSRRAATISLERRVVSKQ
jgi:hypothetical protein